MINENYEFGRYINVENEARWADKNEIRNLSSITKINIENGECATGGIPIISDGKVAYVDGSDTHTMVFGSTGSKKTRLFCMPLINILAMAGESFITTDPKGELFEKTSGIVANNGYKTIVLNFRDFKHSDFWNPLAIPYDLYHKGKRDEAVALINDFVNALAEPQRANTKEVYWVDMAVSQMLASLLFFIETAKKDEANIYSFVNYYMQTCSPDKTQEIADLCTETSIAAVNFKSVLTNKSADKTYASVTSTVAAMLNMFTVRRTLCQVLSRSSFNVSNIGKKRTAIYIIVPDEKTTYHVLVTMFIKQVYELLISEAQKSPKKRLPIRVNFVLDEFANIPKIPEMPSMISAARSRNMRFFLYVQSMQQIIHKYNNEAHTIKGNCDNWVFLTTREKKLLDEISYLCGNASFINTFGNIERKPLISISELQRFNKELGETLILHGRNYPLVTELPDIDDYKFKFLPPFDTSKRALPKIAMYDIDKAIVSITASEIPIPFSYEVHGKDIFYQEKIDKMLKQLEGDEDDWDY